MRFFFLLLIFFLIFSITEIFGNENSVIEEETKENTNLLKKENFENVKPKRKGVLLKADEPEDAKRWAIVIGVNDYNDVGISDLNKARNDAKIMGQILLEQGEFEKVFVMTDDVDPKNTLYPTKNNIEGKLESLLSYAQPFDTIVFFFSGHGVSDEFANGYILPVDTVIDKVNSTSIKVDSIVQKINERGISKSLIILDACRDVVSTTKGATKEGLQADKFQNAEVGATFFSTKSGYYSFEDPDSEFGVFTKYMAYGMEGKADTNGDGIVTFAELEEFVQKEVNDWSLANNKKQKPFVKYFKEKYGDIPITTKGVREKSLVDTARFKGDNTDYLWRSALVPGWGQWNKNQNIRSTTFFSGTLIGLGLFGIFYNSYNQNSENYNTYSAQSFILLRSTYLTYSQNDFRYTQANPGAVLFSSFQITETKSEIKEYAQKLNTISIGLLVLYFTNLLDAYFSESQNKLGVSKSIDNFGYAIDSKSRLELNLTYQPIFILGNISSESNYKVMYTRSF